MTFNKIDYKDKYFSFLGDSITTFEGYNPKNALVYYEGQPGNIFGIEKVEDTWWGQLLNELDAKLLVNDAYSGSTVAQAHFLMMYPAASSPLRLKNLAKEDKKPDVIVIFMGTNDFYNGVPLKSERVDYSGFENAYDYILRSLKDKYPEAEIWLMTVPKTKEKNNPNFVFPDSFGGIRLEEYNEIIRFLADKYQVRLVDIYREDRPYESLDGSHPTKLGMVEIYESVMTSLEK